MFQAIEDLIIFIGWLWQNFTILLNFVFLPLRYVYLFLQNAVSHIFLPAPAAEGIYHFDPQIINMFHNIPYFNLLIWGAIAGLSIIMIVALIKMFHTI